MYAKKERSFKTLKISKEPAILLQPHPTLFLVQPFVYPLLKSTLNQTTPQK